MMIYWVKKSWAEFNVVPVVLRSSKEVAPLTWFRRMHK
jgi:hypothetical protein